MATLFLSTIANVPPYGPVSIAGVAEGPSTVAAAAVNVELNTTINPGMTYADAIAQLQAIENYIRTDATLPVASRVLALKTI